MMKCSPSGSGILAKAINTKILTKNHPDSPHFHPHFSHSHSDFPHSHPHSSYFQPDSQHSHLIPCIPTLILRVLTLIPQVPIIPFPDSPFRLLQIAKFKRHALLPICYIIIQKNMSPRKLEEDVMVEFCESQ